MDAWRAAKRPLDSLAELTVAELRDRLGRGENLHVLDVREMGEWNVGHIDGSHQQSFRQLRQRIADLPFDASAPVAVVCQAGSRASTAASILQSHGFARVWNVSGGMDAWKAAGFGVVDATGCPIGGTTS
jgi:hydroxyacylglutathione hydrolase